MQHGGVLLIVLGPLGMIVERRALRGAISLFLFGSEILMA
jgi:hypothetical protein